VILCQLSYCVVTVMPVDFRSRDISGDMYIEDDKRPKVLFHTA